MTKADPSVLDAATIAEIQRRLTLEQRKVIDALRTRTGQPVIQFWRSWLWPGAVGSYAAWPGVPPNPEGLAWQAARRHLDEIWAEREAEELLSVASLIDDVEEQSGPIEFDPVESHEPVARVTVRLERSETTAPPPPKDESKLSYREAAKLIVQGVKDGKYADRWAGIKALRPRVRSKGKDISITRRLYAVCREHYGAA